MIALASTFDLSLEVEAFQFENQGDSQVVKVLRYLQVHILSHLPFLQGLACRTGLLNRASLDRVPVKLIKYLFQDLVHVPKHPSLIQGCSDILLLARAAGIRVLIPRFHGDESAIIKIFFLGLDSSALLLELPQLLLSPAGG